MSQSPETHGAAHEQLPALEELTLQSAIPGGVGGFSWIDATQSTRHLG